MLIQAIVESYRVVFDHAAKRANPRISANSFIRIAGTLMTDKQHLSFFPSNPILWYVLNGKLSIDAKIYS